MNAPMDDEAVIVTKDATLYFEIGGLTVTLEPSRPEDVEVPIPPAPRSIDAGGTNPEHYPIHRSTV